MEEIEHSDFVTIEVGKWTLKSKIRKVRDCVRGAVKIKNIDKVKTFDWTGGRGGPVLAELINIFKNNKVKSIFTLRGAGIS